MVCGFVHYSKVSFYDIHFLQDFNSESLLAVATAPSASSKTKTIELQNPTVPVELKYTGTLSFKWGFKWEEYVCSERGFPETSLILATTSNGGEKNATCSVNQIQLV